MNLHEYQAKEILKKYGAKTPYGVVVTTPEDAVNAAKIISEAVASEKWAVKAQIHAGGRGKGGGVKIAKSLDDVKKYSDEILGMTLITPQTSVKGKLVRKILIEQNIYYKGNSIHKEYYFSILLNRNTGKTMIMYSTEGGMDIEKVAEKSPELIFTEEINQGVGLLDFQCRNIAFNLKLNGVASKNMQKFIRSAYNAYVGSDASLIEINPLFKASDDEIIVADAKIRLDSNALFRHSDLLEYRDFDEEDPDEVEAANYNLNYVKLSGNVGCMVNGAGLAMATMDIIKQSGGEPANFLDVGGTANAERVEKAFRIILNDKNVKIILINIFGGIVRCDRVAKGIVDAYNNIGDISIPIIVRLQGTNAKEAKELINSSGLKVFSAITLRESSELISKLLNNN